MNARTLAMVLGIAFLIVGIAGFFDPLLSPPPADPDVAVDQGYGLLFGLFPVNLLHNLFHVVTGLAGIALARTISGARTYGKAVAIIYGVLTVMGLFPVLNTTFGLIPIYGHDIWLHALLAIFAAYIGWKAPAETRTTVGGTTGRV